MRFNLKQYLQGPLAGDSHLNGNYPKEYRNEAVHQLQQGSIALAQYKQDYEEQAYINHLMEADLTNLIDEMIDIRDNAKCLHTHLLAGLVINKCRAILQNQDFDLNNLIK